MELDLRAYLDILKRHRWIIIEAAVVVAVVAALLTALRTPTYTATAKVLLRPNDPSESVTQTPTQKPADPERFVSAQINIIQSQAVAAGASQELKGGTPKQLLAHVSVHEAGQNDIINISGHDVDPVRARDIANAFAHAYIENRRQFAIGNLQQAADEIQTKLTQLQTRIAQLDARIQDGGPSASATATATPTGPAAGTTSPAAPVTGVMSPSTDVGALPSDQQTLIAARYAAQVQYQSLFSQQQNISVDISLKRGEAELIAEAETPTAPSSTSAKRNGALGLFVGLLLGVGIAFLREQLNDKIRSRNEAETVTGLPVIAELPMDPDTAEEDDWVSAADVPLGGLAEAARTLRTSLQFLSVDEPIRRLVVTSAGPGDGKSFVAANLAVVYAQAGLRTVLVSGDVRKPRLSRMFGIPRSVRGLTDLLAELSALEQAASRHSTPEPANGHGNGHGNGHAFFAEEPAVPAESPRAGSWWEPTATSAPSLAPGSSITELPPGALSNRQQSLLRSTLVATRVPNLALLPAGAAPPNPAELLGSKRTADLLRELSNIADIVIIDTPPVLAVTDAVVLAEQSDGVLLVTALGETRRSGAERAKGILSTAHTRILGLVLNKVEASESYYYGYYGEPADARQAMPDETRSTEAKPASKRKPAPKRKLARRG